MRSFASPTSTGSGATSPAGFVAKERYIAVAEGRAPQGGHGHGGEQKGNNANGEVWPKVDAYQPFGCCR